MSKDGYTTNKANLLNNMDTLERGFKELVMGFKTGNYITGAGFVLVLLMSAVEPMPHSFELFWLHVGLLMIGAVLMGSGTYLTWKGK